MQKKTRSILEELDALYVGSAIRLFEQIDQDYTPEQAEVLQRKLINAIKLRDPNKFTRSVRKQDGNT